MLQLRTLENEAQQADRQISNSGAGVSDMERTSNKTVESLEQRAGPLKDKQGWQSMCH